MSADNWAICPKCLTKTKEKDKRLKRTLTEQYGKIPLSKWKELESDILCKISDNYQKAETLREDYEIGIAEDGQFSVNYSSGCKVCGFTYDFKYVIEVDLEDK